MIPSTSHSIRYPSPRLESSPVPYVFAGMGLLTLVIGAALVVLACTNHMYRSSGDDEVDDEELQRRQRTTSTDETHRKPAAAAAVLVQLEREPMVVCIMAGDDRPSCIARPLPPPFMGSISPPISWPNRPNN